MNVSSSSYDDQTGVWTLREEFLLPQIVLFPPHPRPTFSAPEEGLDAAEAVLSAMLLTPSSLAAKPKLKGEGRGVVERCLLRVGLIACALGLVPMGATPVPGAALPPCLGGDPPGEDVEVRVAC